jgi:GNAT superfamily N-acetyltransferase
MLSDAPADAPIAVDLADAELAAKVEENLFALFRAMTALPGTEFEEGSKVSRHLAFPTNPMFKGVWRTRLDAANADAAIDDTLAWFRARNAPFFFWWTGPRTTPPDLGERLAARGLLSYKAQAEQFAPGIKSTDLGAPTMGADLNVMNEAALAQTPPGFAIEEVTSEAALQDFKRVLIAGYEMPEWAAQGWVDAAHALGIGKTPWRMYLGRLDGEPVATNMLLCGGGVAGIFGVAVVPPARRKGVGAAISLKPLLDAREQGYRHAVLFATEMAAPTYERIGFWRLPARVNRYLWRNQ